MTDRWNQYQRTIGVRSPFRPPTIDLGGSAPPMRPMTGTWDRREPVQPITMGAYRMPNFFQRMQANTTQALPSIQSVSGAAPPSPFRQAMRDGTFANAFQMPSLPSMQAAVAPAASQPKPAQTPGQVAAMANGQLGGTATGNKVVDIARSYVGKVRYRLGAKPSASEDNPSYWDCSGFITWLDKRYGTGKIPGGAHYQYQYAQQTGQLFTDLSKLRPGDLIFLDTGFKGGAGAWLNNASHVGIYAGNGMMIHATTGKVAGSGTVISPLSAYPAAGKPILGAMRMPWSG